MHEKEYPVRKQIRLREYDYNQNNAYFITICVENRRNLLWDVGAIINRPYAETISTLRMQKRLSGFC
jgi:hypothetical protein